MYRYKIKLMLRWIKDKVVPYREIMFRQPSGVKHISLSPFKQILLFLIVVGFLSWTFVVSQIYFGYNETLEKKQLELEKSQENYKRLMAEVSAYQGQLDDINEKINKNIVLSDNDFDLFAEETTVEPKQVEVDDKKGAVLNVVKKSFVKFFDGYSGTDDNLAKSSISAEEKARLQDDVAWLGRKLNSLSSGQISSSSGAVDVELSKAELQRDLALSEARNLRNKVNEMENLIGEMQKTQVVVFDKVANLADEGISAIEKKLSGVKDSLDSVGLGFETLLARIDVEYGADVATGGPFIPVALSSPIKPDLKSEVLNASLNNLVGNVDKWNNLAKLEEILPIGKPVDRVRITSRFGFRQDPFTKRRSRHEGLDFGGIQGEPIYTMSPGRVIYSGVAGSFGYMVEIDHGLGIRTRYAHLGSIAVKRGEKVTLGQKIGTMGNSGRSTGVHLHYEIRMKGKPLDPLNFVRINRNVSKKY